MNETHATSGPSLTVSSPHLVIPSSPVAIRVATMADLPFLDALQKRHSKALGYFPTKQFEGYIEMGGVLVAESVGSRQRAASSEAGEDGSVSPGISLPTAYCPLPTPLGYVISRDRYLKRDELGVIYQLCVAPGHQRGLIGATLIKEVFNRSAYGCRLYCCWCAQDLNANYFWESLGFVPIAFRAGSTGKRRVHIFWQRRINADDVGTPYWYPCQTNSGAIREDRLVFPIPPGTHWRDIRPVDVHAVAVASRTQSTGTPALSAPREAKMRRGTKAQGALQPPPSRPSAGRQYGPPSAGPIVDVVAETPKPAPPRVKSPRGKIDPKLVAKARELRDRYLERVNDQTMLPASGGKYDVSRSFAAPDAPRALPNAA